MSPCVQGVLAQRHPALVGQPPWMNFATRSPRSPSKAQTCAARVSWWRLIWWQPRCTWLPIAGTEPPTFLPGTIHLEFRGHKTAAEVILNKWNQDADCVLLRCLDPGALAAYPTIPLRELNHSDDLFKTRGYPDAQPIDGVTWAGKVRDHAAQLTNFYATRRSAYEPVLQLFCEEAGAGTGAPPKGLSGAPIIVGSAAIGLMRFALMQDSRAVAGTLYGCSAGDIVALDPEQLSLRLPLAPTVLLTPEQMAQLAGFLVAAFADNLSGLRRTVRFSLGAQVERSVTPAKDVDEFITRLLPTLAQQGPGMISVLLRGAITARPTNQDLRAFAQISPYALKPLSDDRDVQEAHDRELETKIERALIDLNRIRQARDLHHIMASYRPRTVLMRSATWSSWGPPDPARRHWSRRSWSRPVCCPGPVRPSRAPP